MSVTKFPYSGQQKQDDSFCPEHLKGKLPLVFLDFLPHSVEDLKSTDITGHATTFYELEADKASPDASGFTGTTIWETSMLPWPCTFVFSPTFYAETDVHRIPTG